MSTQIPLLFIFAINETVNGLQYQNVPQTFRRPAAVGVRYVERDFVA